MLLAWVLHLSVNDHPLLLAKVIELLANGLGEGHEGAVVFALLGRWVWSFDAHGRKSLGLVGDLIAKCVCGRECAADMCVDYGFI